jgi:hypothetical protein
MGSPAALATRLGLGRLIALASRRSAILLGLVLAAGIALEFEPPRLGLAFYR